MSENDAAPVSHQKQPRQNATNAIEIEQNAAKSTKLIDILPLITDWLQVRVLPGPPTISMSCQRPETGEFPHRTRNDLVSFGVRLAPRDLVHGTDR
jgi:hypothetical protein